ncbi:MAG: hypothetical protein P1V20_21935 [Verrucomicrobiales bacterium]|nr:hypothetical protein [Verrucomicrobiales bacterium]
MKPIKKIPYTFLLPLFAVALAFTAAPAKADTYLALMTGCTKCNSCKKKVVAALAEMDSVSRVLFLKQMRGELYQVVVETSDSSEISFNEVATAIQGMHNYELKNWGRVKARN